MNSVRFKGIENILFVGNGVNPHPKQLVWMNILKARDGDGKFTVTYDRLSGKLQGMEFDEVYFDEIPSLGDNG